MASCFCNSKTIGSEVRRYRFLKRSVMDLTDETYLILLDGDLDFAPGQFAMIDGGDSLTRKPYTLGRLAGGISISVKIVGPGSRHIVTTERPIELLAPLGRPFEPPSTGSGAVLVAPSCVAEGVHLAEAFCTKLFVCSKTPLNSETVRKICELGDLEIETVIGNEAFLRTLESLRNSEFSWFFVSGSRVMEELAFRALFPKTVYASLNEYMGCGLGACKSCAVETVDGIKHVCTDGPVFRGDLVWRI